MIRQSDCTDRFRRVHLAGDRNPPLPPSGERRAVPAQPSFGTWREVRRG